MSNWFRLTNREHVILFLLILDVFIWVLSLNMHSFRGHLVLFVVGVAAFAAAIWQLVVYIRDHLRMKNAFRTRR